MKIRLLFILFVAMCTKTSAQKNLLAGYTHTINYSDHKITLQLQEMGQERKFTDPAKKYYWFSSNQIKVTQGGYSGKLLDGNYSDYYLNNNLKEKGRFDMGLKTGEWNYWTDKGILLSKVNYRDGILSGQFFKYDTAGNLAEQGSYKNGLVDGKFIKTISKDSAQTSYYKNGSPKPVRKERKWWDKLSFWKKSKKG